MKYNCFPESCKPSTPVSCLNITVNCCCCDSKPEPKPQPKPQPKPEPPKPCPPKPQPVPNIIINCGECKKKSPKPPYDADDCGCDEPYDDRYDGEEDC